MRKAGIAAERRSEAVSAIAFGKRKYSSTKPERLTEALGGAWGKQAYVDLGDAGVKVLAFALVLVVVPLLDGGRTWVCAVCVMLGHRKACPSTCG